jgi:CheY-like chemotaxis protein
MNASLGLVEAADPRVNRDTTAGSLDDQLVIIRGRHHCFHNWLISALRSSTFEGGEVSMAQKMVLLVEDDPDIRDIVQDVLEAEGFDVVPASHGKQALEFLDGVRGGTRPVLVILDMMMPLVDGRRVLEAIRADQDLASIPVVVMSAIAHEKPAGATAFLRKPFSLDTLFDAVHTLVEGPAALAGV